MKNKTDQELFLKLTKSKQGKTYWDIIQELRSRPNVFVFTKSLELMTSESIKEKIIGIDVVAQLGNEKRPFYKETIKFLFDFISKESNSKLLSSALIAISHNNNELNNRQIEILSAFKNHRSYKLRYAVALSLSGLVHSKAIETLIFLSRDKKEMVRDWATFGLGTQIDIDNETIREALWERVNDIDNNTRLEAIVGLAKRKDFRVKEIIKQELVAGEYGTLILEAIQFLGIEEYIPLFNANLEKK